MGKSSHLSVPVMTWVLIAVAGILGVVLGWWIANYTWITWGIGLHIARYVVERVLQLLSILVTWPVAAVTIAILFLKSLRSEVAGFLNRLGTFKAPGGWELSEGQHRPPTPSEGIPSDRQANQARETEQDERLRVVAGVLSQKLAELSGEKEQLSQQVREFVGLAQNQIALKDKEIRAKADVSYFWYFKYLARFLVPHTQAILRWFAVQGTVSQELYSQIWNPAINAEEAQKVLEVLLAYSLIQNGPGGYVISQRGRNFVQFVNNDERLPPSDQFEPV